MIQSPTIRFLLLATLLAGALYGVSYQQYRYFNPEDSMGLCDTKNYLAIAAGDCDEVSNLHRYRFLTPLLASWIRGVLPPLPHESDAGVLAFFIVNFVFNWAAAMVLFAVLKQYGMSDLLSLTGSLLYIASRVTVMTTGAPLIDAVVFAALISLVWLINRDRPLALALCMPLLVLAKETMLPLMFLPLFTKQRRRPEIWIGIVAAFGAFFLARYLWTQYMNLEERSLAGDTTSFIQETLLMNIRRLFSLGGLHDLGCGFTFLLPWALVGASLNRRTPYYPIPGYLLLLLPIAFGYAILNGNFGRLFQFAFPVVIPYALIAVQAILGQNHQPSSAAPNNAR